MTNQAPRKELAPEVEEAINTAISEQFNASSSGEDRQILYRLALKVQSVERERAATMLDEYTALDAYEFPRPGTDKRMVIEEGVKFEGLDDLREDIIEESYGCGIKYLIQFGRGVFHDAVIRSAKHFAAAIRRGEGSGE